MKIVFLGTPSFSVPILEALAKKYEVVLVVSQPNRIKKKGVFLPTPVAEAATRLGIELYQPEKVNDHVEYLASFHADVLITAAYGQYLSSKILKIFNFQLNVHGSLLPLHRGGAPIQRSLMNGDEQTGVTIMKMAKKLDAGTIYAMQEYKISEDDNSTSLFAKLSLLGRDLLLDNIENIVNGSNTGYPQDEKKATYSPNILPNEEVIDLRNNTKTIVNQIRGLSLEPGAYLVIKGIKLKVLEAKEFVITSDALPGTVLITKKRIVLKTLDSAIELKQVIYPGKNLMSGAAFSNGQKIFNVGDYLISE